MNYGIWFNDNNENHSWKQTEFVFDSYNKAYDFSTELFISSRELGFNYEVRKIA